MDEKRTSVFKFSPEAKVGLFVLLGVALLVYMSLRIGGIKFGRAEGYILYVSFSSAAGLDKDAPVRVAGVEVGKIKEITLKDNKARLTLQINKGVKLGKDFTAVLTTKGLLGEKYLELIPGAPGAPLLKDKDEVTHTITYADMDKLLTVLSEVSVDIKKVTETLGKVLGGPEGEQTLKNIINNIDEISFRINRLVANNDEQFNRIIRNINDFTATLKEEGPQISSDIKQAIQSINTSLTKTSDNLNQLIEDNRGDIKEGVANLKVAAVKLQEAMDNINKVTKDIGPQIQDTMASVDSITKKLDKGEGTLGRLINDPVLHENINKTVTGINKYLEKAESFHTYVGYRGEYLLDERQTKSYVSLRLQPKADKYYLIELIDDPRGKRKKETRESTTSGVTTTTTDITTTETFKFSAEIAKRFSDVVLRGGIIESRGGVGVDYYLFKDGLKLSLEAFDFRQKGNPHLKGGATIYFSKYFHLVAGYDDIISRQRLGATYIGLGLQFDDEDLKYLLGTNPPVKF